MEQRIEMFYGDQANQGLAFVNAKHESEKLLKEGWFIEEMASQYFERGSQMVSQLMVVYRRKA